MALRRLLLRLLTEAKAAAAARGRAPSAEPSVSRRCGWILGLDAMSAAGARGQKIRSCACARVRAIRADGEAATTAAVASAQARAQAALAFCIRSGGHAGEAAAVAGARLRQASDQTIYIVLRILYGDTAPVVKIPSTIDETMYVLEALRGRIEKLNDRLVKVNNTLEAFLKLDPALQSLIISVMATPFLAIGAFFAFMIPDETVSSAPPEFPCPFLGICGAPLDEESSAQESLMEVLSLVGTCGGLAVITVIGLGILLVTDIADLLHVKGLLDLIFNIKNDVTLKEEKLRKSYTLADIITTEGANYLDIKQLLELTCHTGATMTIEEIGKTFNIKNDFSLEDKKMLMYLIWQSTIKATPEEIGKTFNIKNDFTTEDIEKLRPFYRR